MKTKLLFIGMLLLAVIFYSCSEEDNNIENLSIEQ